jgi:hypothetical protein
MKRKIISVLFAVVLVLSLSLVTAVPAGADGGADRVTAITNAADRLVALQSTATLGLLSPPDFGWDWVVTGLTQHSASPSGANLYGVTALGLIDAYQVTGTTAYFTAAEKTADHLLTLDRSVDSAVRIYSFDYRFLVEFSALSGNPSYEAHALAQWIVAQTVSAYFYADGNQEQYYQWCLDVAGVSPGYAAWSIGDVGLAALAMGDTSWAGNMAAVLASHLTDITGTDDWRFIGWGKALEFLNAVDSGTYSTEITSLISNLTGSQNTDGSWPGTAAQGTVQNTAYAVMGLAAVGKADAAREGADWLVTNQISTGGSIGGWIETDSEEYSENDSEALQALASVVPVTIDIKPGSDPNSINLKSKGLIPVAVLTTDCFDASTIDPETVLFAGAEPVRWVMEDVDGDDDLDMLFHFKTQDLDLDEDSTEATLTAYTYDPLNRLIVGKDTVNIVPKGKGK